MAPRGEGGRKGREKSAGRGEEDNRDKGTLWQREKRGGGRGGERLLRRFAEKYWGIG